VTVPLWPTLQAALLSEREEAKLAVALEKQALEEARTARVKVRRHGMQPAVLATW
jgi:hypothetical protein